VQYKNIFGDDFQRNQVSCHLFRSGGGDASPASPLCPRLVTKTNQFCTDQRQVENCASGFDRVCDYYLIWVGLGSCHTGKNETVVQYDYEGIALLILLYYNRGWVKLRHVYLWTSTKCETLFRAVVPTLFSVMDPFDGLAESCGPLWWKGRVIWYFAILR